jgi:CRP/FNR family cyclic AMP-dependent transcriptional regulator
MDSANQPVLSDGLLATLSARGDLKTFPRGELLITEGDSSDSLFILIAGELKVFTRDTRGRELVYNVLRPGEFFGEMFLDGGPRSASVKAVSTSVCAVVGQDEFRCFMKEYPEFAESLVLKLIARVRRATEQTRSLALHGVYERVVALLNELAQPDGQGGRAIDNFLTQQEIADRIGATREMVNQVLRNLTVAGYLIRGEGRRMLITRALPEHHAP